MIFSLSLLFLLLLHERVTNASKLSLDSNGEYENLVIAIDESVPQSTELITNIKEKFTKASSLLDAATRRHGSGGLSFKTVHILLPDDWTVNVGRIEASKWQSFDQSDIRIYQSVNITDSPSTLQNGSCGSPGVYTRYTDYYFLNEERLEELEGPASAPPEKMIVHQWAHYRWGVFDEHPTKSFPNQFYSKGGNIEPARCSKSLKGRIDSKVGLKCHETNRVTNGSSKNCSFTPTVENDARGSLMFAPQVPSVTQFCDSTSTDPDLRHNSDFPNHHNEICGGDSVWDVMRRHRDFTTDYPQNKNTIPEFKIIQKKNSQRLVIMLIDVSRNMRGANIETLKSAAKIYIQKILEPTAQLALVPFSTKAWVLQNLQSMDSENARQSSISKIESLSTVLSSNIPDGLVTAFRLLGGNMGSPESYLGNGYILLISDGQDAGRSDPYTFDQTIQILQRSSVVVDSISIGSNTDNRLKSFAENTNGKYFMADPSSFSTTMIESFVSTLGTRVKKEEKLAVVSKGSVSINQPATVIATINQEFGQDTSFVLKLPSNVRMMISSPSGVQYFRANGSPIYVEQNEGQSLTVTINIPGIAEPGQWRARMVTQSFIHKLIKRNPDDDDPFANFVVITKPRKNSTASVSYEGRIDCGNIEQADTNTRCPCTMVLTNHGKAILNAEVTMVVVSPQSREEKRVAMLDNGIGDGVYTASIVGKDLTQKGIYNIRVEMKFKLKPDDKNFITRIETVGGLKVINPYSPRVADTTTPDQIRDPGVGDTTTPDRIRDPGVADTTTPDRIRDPGVGDTTRPYQIREVIGDVVDMKKKLVQLTFTAVGDDGDREKASLYQFKLNDKILSGEEFSRKPNDPGSEEKITLSLDKVTQSMNTTSFNLLIRAVDDEGNEGKWSQPVFLSLKSAEIEINGSIILKSSLLLECFCLCLSFVSYFMGSHSSQK